MGVKLLPFAVCTCSRCPSHNKMALTPHLASDGVVFFIFLFDMHLYINRIKSTIVPRGVLMVVGVYVVFWYVSPLFNKLSSYQPIPSIRVL